MKNEELTKIVVAIGRMLVGFCLLAWGAGTLIAGFVLFPEALYLSDRLVLEGNGYAVFFPVWLLITALTVAIYSINLGIITISSAIPSKVRGKRKVVNSVKAKVIGIGSARYFNAHWKRLMFPVALALIAALFVQGLAPSEWSSGVYLVVLFPLLALFGWGFYRVLAKTTEAGEALWKQEGKGAISE